MHLGEFFLDFFKEKRGREREKTEKKRRKAGFFYALYN